VSKVAKLRLGDLLVCEPGHSSGYLGKVDGSLNDFVHIPTGTVVEYLFRDSNRLSVHVLSPVELLAREGRDKKRKVLFRPEDQVLRVDATAFHSFSLNKEDK